MPSLTAVYNETMAKYYLQALNGTKLFISDRFTGEDGKIADYSPILNWDATDFRYGTAFDASLTYGCDSIPFKLTIFESGMVKFDAVLTDKVENDNIFRSKEEQSQEMMRMRLKGVYYFLRSIFDCEEAIPFDRIQVSDDRQLSPIIKYGDDLITIRPAKDECEATYDVLRALITLIKSNVKNTSLRDSFDHIIDASPIKTSYMIVDEYALYGLSLLVLQADKINKDDCLRYEGMFNRYLKLNDSRRQSYELVQNIYQTKESNRLSRRGLVLSGIAIFVSFLAGSILCDVITGSATDTMLKVYTIVILIVTFLLATVCIYFVVYRESSNFNPEDPGKEPKEGFRYDRGIANRVWTQR